MNRSVLLFAVCLMFFSQSMSGPAHDSFEEEEEDEDFDRPPTVNRNKPKPYIESGGGNGNPQTIDPKRLNCPLCDSSVYSYCSDKLLHDACCCLSSSDTDDLPPQCNYADCSFLHANTCREHRLITACCCNQRL